MYETILLTIRDHIATITFHRPEAMNSFITHSKPVQTPMRLQT